MKPNNVYKPQAPAPRPQTERPQLRLIPGDGRGPRPIGRWIALAGVVLITGTVWMFSGSATPEPTVNTQLQSTLHQLETVYRREGILTFQEAKARLKLQVADALKANPDDDVAEGIAVYLFPDLLPEENFEKDVAIEGWARQEATIEGYPRSNQSRSGYQELQSNIWQYETADAGNPALSQVAASVLRIYQGLSAP